MSDLFAPNPTENLLPYDGTLYDLGALDLAGITERDLYQSLLTTLSWHSDVVRLFGKTHITRRQIVWMGKAGLSYRYAGHTHQAQLWHPTVLAIKTQIEKQLQRSGMVVSPNYFNACLLNYYPSGSEGMGYHADDERELGDLPTIATLSLGATRKMAFKHKKTSDKVALHLTHGQCIVMAGVTQQFWRHSIAKTTTTHEGRISLTFRRIYQR